jgi:hypothetical protein
VIFPEAVAHIDRLRKENMVFAKNVENRY